MKMGRGFLTLSAVLLSTAVLAGTAAAQGDPYLFVNRPGTSTIIPLPFSPRAMPGPTDALWTNPAGIGWDGSSGLLLLNSFTDGSENYSVIGDDYGIGVNLGPLAYGYEAMRAGATAERHTFAFSSRISEGLHLGLAYHWSNGLDQQNSYDFGFLARPTRWISLGAQVEAANSPRVGLATVDPAYHLGLAVRPLGPRLTLALDASLWKTPAISYGDTLDLTLTADLVPVPGLRLRGGYAMDRELVFVGLSFNFGHVETASYGARRGSTTAGLPTMAGASTLRLSSHRRHSLLTPLEKPVVIYWKMKGEIIEEEEPFSLFKSRRMTLFEALQRVEKLRRDKKVRGLLLQLDNPVMGPSDRLELREALQRFRDAGKVIFVYADDLHLGGLVLASVADTILFHPIGMVAIPGFDVRQPFFKGTLDSLGIQPQFLQEGKYKSAAETLTRSDMSEPAREEYTAFFDDLWRTWTGTIAEGRGVPVDTVSAWVDGALYTAAAAKERGIVDDLVYSDEVKKRVLDSVQGSPRMVTTKRYFARETAREEWKDMTSPKIALIYAVGNINTGRSTSSPFGGKVMGSETIAKAIRDARNDRRVKAIVLRVDSGGGSALASDIILREVERTTNPDLEGRHIPLIVSFSDIAGSGGYYIACKADTIVAPPTCLTGSIGVVGGKFILADLYRKLGITHDGIRYGRNAGLGSTLEPWNEEQLTMVRASMEEVYDRFVRHVSEGRGLDTARVKEIGQGRIWSGIAARQRGLVDVEGGLRTAIDIARDRAGMDPDRPVQLVVYPRIPGINVRIEAQYVRLAAMPLYKREALITEEAKRRISGDGVMLLCPLDEKDLPRE